MDLSHNQIADLSSVSNWSQLKQVDLSHNQISDLAPLSKSKQINQLNLSHNQIADLSVLSQLKSLQNLDLAHNQISFENLKSITSLNNLSELRLSHNQIQNLPPLASKTGRSISGLTRLRLLELQGNQISHLNILTGAVQKLNNVRQLKLNIQNNPFSNTTYTTQLSALKKLVVGNNLQATPLISQLIPLRDLNLENGIRTALKWPIPIPVPNDDYLLT